MTRRLLGLLAALCLTSACKDEPVGEMKPIVPPAGTPIAPKQGDAPKPSTATEPPADPNKVTLRWKLATPAAFRLTLHSTESAAPVDPKAKKGAKPPSPTPTTAGASGDTVDMVVLYKAESGDPTVRIVPQGGSGAADTGSVSERGFVLGGLTEPLRTPVALALELPRDPVGPNSTWALGTNLLELSSVSEFVEQKTERHNQVKLASLAPGDGGEQVATLDYELSENHIGQLRTSKSSATPAPRPGKKPAAGKKDAGKKGGVPVNDEEGDEPDADEPSANGRATEAATAEVTMKGHGEFLVKAGRWRSWQATLTTRTTGMPIPGTAPGERSLSLTPVEPVPPELLPPPPAKK